ncbi:MAG: L,D-transpeptidase family protein [Bacteroidota bacterium]
MTRISIAIALLSLPMLSMNPFIDGDFRSAQKKYERVKTAYSEKQDSVKKWLKAKNIDINTVNIFLRAFKKEGTLEVWARNKGQSQYVHLRDYSICASSGVLGPKRKQGDGQVPEGFYVIDRFNPVSNFYLSLGINYPNESDKKLGHKGNLGGDVFIHGNCVTIGCIPVTDDKIKELYVLAVEARNAGQSKIPVDIYPCRMNEEGMLYLSGHDGNGHETFWKNLKEGYDWFEKKKTVPKVYVDKEGKYSFN